MIDRRYNADGRRPGRGWLVEDARQIAQVGNLDRLGVVLGRDRDLGRPRVRARHTRRDRLGAAVDRQPAVPHHRVDAMHAARDFEAVELTLLRHVDRQPEDARLELMRACLRDVMELLARGVGRRPSLARGIVEQPSCGRELVELLAVTGEVEEHRHRGLGLLVLLERAACLGELPCGHEVATLAE
jgi:hypothetical protein